ncbi:MAG TPA: signal peptidase I [Clostridia bacterium]|nr:signal peptidase I [Clostridia bacterium]
MSSGFESFEEESIISRELENNETVDEGPAEDIGEDAVDENENTEELAEEEKETVEVKSVTLSYMKVLKSIMSWVWTIVLAFFIAVIINSYVIRASEVFGRSMYPTLEQGDVVFISRMPYIFGKPKHGDIVVFDSTLEKRNFFTEIKESVKYNMITQKFFKTEKSNKYWIKRVIGVPGDVLEIKDGKLYRNGELLEEDYVNSASPITYKNLVPPSMGDGDLTRIVVKEGEIYCMGDNRNHSEDSRAIGPVPINDVLGKVIYGAK